MSGYKIVGGDIVGSTINGEQLEVAKDLVMAAMVVGVVLDADAVMICSCLSIAVSWWFFWMYGRDACACVSMIDTQALPLKCLGISRSFGVTDKHPFVFC